MNAGRMLFHRDFREYTGGHGKVWDYFNHALALGWDARVYLTPDSILGEPNPWHAVPHLVESHWQPESTDLLFLGGMDWLALGERDASKLPPVLNLVQHVRHADPGLPLRAFLSRSASRICVSAAVAEAISGTGEVCGPVHVVPAALDLAAVQSHARHPKGGVVIGALKHKALGDAVAERLRALGVDARLLRDWLPRAAFLDALASAEIAVLLPHETEGFFLPGLEAMTLGTALVMPGSLGSDAYARHGMNCLMPAADAESIVVAVLALRNPELCDRLCAEGKSTAAAFDLPAERTAFASVLQGLQP